jgi:hypothetical protein
MGAVQMSTNLQQIASNKTNASKHFEGSKRGGDGLEPSKQPPSSTRRKKSPYKAAMATKVRWAMQDSLAKTEDARKRMRLILDWVDELRQINSLDIKVLAHLGKLDHQIGYLALDVADLERILERAVAESKEE